MPKSKGAKKGRTVEQIYQKKTQLEHILLRPDTYGRILNDLSDSQYVFVSRFDGEDHAADVGHGRWQDGQPPYYLRTSYTRDS